MQKIVIAYSKITSLLIICATKTREIISYSNSDRFAFSPRCSLNFECKSNLCFNTLIVGQIVTVGNGIDEIGIFSPNLKEIEFSFQSSQTSRIIEPHMQSTTTKPIIHHTLINFNYNCN